MLEHFNLPYLKSLKRKLKPTLISTCLLCKEPTTALVSLSFGDAASLPGTYETRVCPSCEFGFARPEGLDEKSLNQYYSGNKNDHVLDFDREMIRFEEQYQIILDQLQKVAWSPSSVLDYGCGDGALLKIIGARTGIEQEKLVGIDVMDSRHLGEGWTYKHYTSLESMKNELELAFDLVILSHTLEHLIDFDVLDDLGKLLSPNGYIYVEVPNASRYLKDRRLTPGYYLDRLHINHFSTHSLLYLMSKKHLSAVATIEYSFVYKDGLPYPVVGVLAQISEAFTDTFSKYVDQEKARLQANFSEMESADIIIWGVGDNFFRAESMGGFTSCNIAALADRAKIGKSFGGRQVVSIENALNAFPTASVLITSSWESNGMKDYLSSLDPNRKVWVL